MTNSERHLLRERLFRKKNAAKSMIQRAKKGAMRRGLVFTISEADIVPLPTYCPALGIKLDYLAEKGGDIGNCASLDRIDSTRGYEPGNVRVISYRANSIKRDATLKELRGIVRYMMHPFDGKGVKKLKPCKVCGALDRNPSGKCRPCHARCVARSKQTIPLN